MPEGVPARASRWSTGAVSSAIGVRRARTVATTIRDDRGAPGRARWRVPEGGRCQACRDRRVGRGRGRACRLRSVGCGRDAEEAARRFLEANPDVARYLAAAAIGGAIIIVVLTLAEDIATLGAGIADDPASSAAAFALVRVAQQMAR